MSVVSARPRSPALAPFIESLNYHEGEVPAAVERVLPTGRIHVLVNLYEDEFRTYSGSDCATVHRTRGAVLGGPYSQPTVIDTREQRCLVMVHFKLGGAAPFFAPPLSEAHDRLIELDQLWGRGGRVLRERLLEAPTPEAKLRVLEAVLLDHLADPHDSDPTIRFAASAFERGVPVSEVTSSLGLLPKTFVHRFRRRVGLTPKLFSRVRRLATGGAVDPRSGRGRLVRACRRFSTIQRRGNSLSWIL